MTLFTRLWSLPTPLLLVVLLWLTRFYFFFVTLSSSSQVKDVWHEEKVYIYLLFFLKIDMLNVKYWVLKKTIGLISEIEVQNKDR